MLDTRPRHWATLLLLAACGAACGKAQPFQADDPAPAPTTPKSPPPTAKWDAKYAVKLQFEVDDYHFEKAHCDFDLLAPKGEVVLDVDCAYLPHPVDVTFEGTTNHNGDSEYDHFTFKGDFNKRLSAVPLDALKDKNNPKFAPPIQISIVFDGYQPMNLTPPALWVSSDVFMSWAGHPVRFTETDRADDGKKSALLVHEGYAGHELVGEGTLLDDLDFIAVQRDLPEPAVGCFGGRLNYRTEADVTLYDRRTGASVDTHHFVNKAAGCPSEAIVSDVPQYQSAIDPNQVKTWLKTRIKK